MKIPATLLAGLFAAATFVGAVQVGAAGRAAGGDKDIKLTGCLIRGEDGDGYLIANLPSEPAASSETKGSVTTTAIGTAGAFSNVFYWLGDDGDLKNHVGHRVEIEGHLKGDLKEGEIKLDRKDRWTELRVKADGRSMKAKVPNAFIEAGSSRDKNRKMTAIVRRVDVDHVRMLAASCD